MPEQTEPLNFIELINGIEVVYDSNSEFLDTAIERAVREVVTKVSRHQKVGELNLKMKFKPLSPEKMVISCELKTKVPQPSAAERHVYLNRKGELVADDPKQPMLPGADIRAVNR